VTALGAGVLWSLFDSEAPLGICMVRKQVSLEEWPAFVRDPLARRTR
jgi:hypothetical protein